MVVIVTSSGIDSDVRELKFASSMHSISYYTGMHRATLLTCGFFATDMSPALSGIHSHKHSANITLLVLSNNRNETVDTALIPLPCCLERRDSIPGGDKKSIFSSVRPNRLSETDGVSPGGH